MSEITSLVRKNILSLKPYSCARDEFKGEAEAYLDANENPLNYPYNRYPDPLQWSVKERIAAIKGVHPGQVFLGNGSDEAIDLVFRVFCEPRQDNVVAIDPTYGMYQVSADINDVEYRKVRLNADYSLDAQRVLDATDVHTKVIFLCSPNNPTANLLNRKEMLKIVEGFTGITVIDEAYIDFSSEPSWLKMLDRYPRLIVLQTFSKAWGLAGVRLGMAFASEEIIGLYNKVKYPYNINVLTQRLVLDELEQVDRKAEWVNMLLKERFRLIELLKQLDMVEEVYPTDANFLLVKVPDANAVYRYLVDKSIIVRNRNTVALCEGCLRITVGVESENELLLKALGEYRA
ncbi:MAG: histidinol phosphate aminotransferase apoenzyme [Bacteroidetes bacterium]|nr:histidinol phosphate aminotransferase apoenzyme [Bacteroidota bacterium]